MGVPKASGVFDYSSDLVQKYKTEVGEKVKELLNMENFNNNAQNSNTSSNTPSTANKIKDINEVNFDDCNVKEKTVEPIKEEKPEYKEPTKFMNFSENVNVKVVSNGNNGNNTKSKRGVQKIQKVDFDFNFDNFNEVNFSSFSGTSESIGKSNTDADFDNAFGSSNSDIQKKKKKSEDMEEDEENQYNTNKPKICKEEINKKFANKKAISSEDYANLDENPSQNSNIKSKISSMKYSTAISSSDLYGEPEDGKYLIF